MLMRVNEYRITDDEIKVITDCLKRGGVIIYPTDSVYALGCDIMQARAVERVCRIRRIKPEKANFSFICSDLSHVSNYAKPIPNHIFRVMKRVLPGPYTFILEANNEVPRILKQNKKTVGIRVPDNNTCRAIVSALGNPMISASLHDDEDDIMEYFSDPAVIHERMGNVVDLVIDGGFGNIFPSTVVDASTGEIVLVREGLGDTAILME